MKDEEIAEEIANKRCHEIMCFGHCNFSSPKHHRCGEWHREYNCALEGLKAGRPQWHDLRKDPNDLPKKSKSYWVYIDCQGNKIYRSIVWQGRWLGWDCIPLAWCEEPTFDKE